LDPSEVLLGSEAPRLLGRTVEDVDHPISGYVPEDSQEVLKAVPEPMEVVSCDVHQQISAGSSTEVKARMTQIFGLDAGREQWAERQVVARMVITRMLRQHHLVYDTLMDKHWDKITSLLPKQATSSGYMIVGIKTCVDAEIEASAGAGTTGGVTMEVSVQQVGAAFGVVNPLGDMLNPMVKVNREKFL
jgi:hypothetical protein